LITYAFDIGPNDRILVPDLLLSDGITASVFFQDRKCIDRMNNDSHKLADTAGKIDTACVKIQYGAGGGDATPCVDDPNEPKTQAREARLLSDFATFCPTTPAWGVNGATCCEDGANEGLPCSVPADCPGGTCSAGACIGHAAEYAANDMSHELFGGGVIVDPLAGKCQADVLKRTAKLLTERWKTFRTCKRTNFGTITNDPMLVATCLGPPQAQADPRARIQRAEVLLNTTVGRCVSAGFTPVGAYFGGACSGTPDPLFSDCVAQRVRCAFCRGVNVADDIVPPLDCELFDDGAFNGSCP
jgi:hypothetical protein